MEGDQTLQEWSSQSRIQTYTYYITFPFGNKVSSIPAPLNKPL